MSLWDELHLTTRRVRCYAIVERGRSRMDTNQAIHVLIGREGHDWDYFELDTLEYLLPWFYHQN